MSHLILAIFYICLMWEVSIICETFKNLPVGILLVLVKYIIKYQSIKVDIYIYVVVLKQILCRIQSWKSYHVCIQNLSFCVILGCASKTNFGIFFRNVFNLWILFYFNLFWGREDHGNCMGRKACSQMAGFLAIGSIVSWYLSLTLSFSVFLNIYSKNIVIAFKNKVRFFYIDCILKKLKYRTDP